MSPLVDILKSVITGKYNDGSSYTTSTPNEIIKDYLDTILDYIKSNMKGVVTYAGTMTTTPPVPDPVVSDVIGVWTTNVYTPFVPVYDPDNIGASFTNWSRYLLTNIYNNVFIDQGLYLAKPLLPINFFNMQMPTVSMNWLVLRNVYKDDCDDNGRLKDDVDIVRDCQSALIDDLFNILRSSIMTIPYAATNIAQTSSGLATISVNQIE